MITEMSHHCCNHSHTHTASKNLGIAFFLNFGFAILEFVGGIACNSVAILSDAIHDLGDSLAIAFAWILQKISQKKRTECFSYGWKRFSLLGAIINGLILVIGSIFILFETIPRILTPEVTDTKIMIALSILGIAINGVAVLKTKQGKSLNEKMINLHLLEDLLGWGTVLVGSIIIHFTGWYILDSIMALGITVYILFHAAKMLKSSVKIILQAIPENINLQKIREKILQDIPEIKELHDMHVWSLDGEKNVGSVHIIVDKKTFTVEKSCTLKQKIREFFAKQGIEHITIELETKGENCGLETC